MGRSPVGTCHHCAWAGSHCLCHPAPRFHHPQRRFRFSDIGKLSGPDLVNGIRRMDPVRSLTAPVLSGACNDPDRVGHQPVVQPAKDAIRALTGYSFDFGDDAVDYLIEQSVIFAFGHDTDQRFSA